MGKFTKKNAAKMGRKGADARWHKRPEQKTDRRAATVESSGDKSNSPNALGAPAPAGIRENRPTTVQNPTRRLPAPESITRQAPPPEFIQKPRRLAPLLCPPCRRLGYANCRACILATDSSLTLDGDMIFGVR